MYTDAFIVLSLFYFLKVLLEGAIQIKNVIDEKKKLKLSMLLGCSFSLTGQHRVKRKERHSANVQTHNAKEQCSSLNQAFYP